MPTRATIRPLRRWTKGVRLWIALGLCLSMVTGASYAGYRIWRHLHVPLVTLNGVTEHHENIDGQDAWIIEADPDDDSPKPLALVIHGYGVDERVLRTPYMGDFTQELADAGWLVASSAAHGDAWGNAESTAAYADLYEHVADSHDISEVVIVSASMGAISGLQLIATDAIPNVTAWVGVSPVTDLAAMSEDGDWSDKIRSKLTGSEIESLNPMNLNLPDLPMTVYTSELDTITTTGVHAEPFAERFGAAIIRCDGGHVAPDCFRASDLIR